MLQNNSIMGPKGQKPGIHGKKGWLDLFVAKAAECMNMKMNTSTRVITTTAWYAIINLLWAFPLAIFFLLVSYT